MPRRGVHAAVPPFFPLTLDSRTGKTVFVLLLESPQKRTFPMSNTFMKRFGSMRSLLTLLLTGLLFQQALTQGSVMAASLELLNV